MPFGPTNAGINWCLFPVSDLSTKFACLCYHKKGLLKHQLCIKKLKNLFMQLS